MTSMRVLQGVLYGGAPFFSYPWKPLINASVGSAYKTAYEHFRRDHALPANLAAHLVCLAWQLGSNYALLDAMDEWIDRHRPGVLDRHVAGTVMTVPKRLFAKLTTISWCASLLAVQGCPLPVKLASVGCIGKIPHIHLASLLLHHHP